MKYVISNGAVKATTHNKDGLRHVSKIPHDLNQRSIDIFLKELNRKNSAHFLKTGFGINHALLDAEVKNFLGLENGN